MTWPRTFMKSRTISKREKATDKSRHCMIGSNSWRNRIIGTKPKLINIKMQLRPISVARLKWILYRLRKLQWKRKLPD